MRANPLFALSLIVALTGFVTGCNHTDIQRKDYGMGEKVSLGPLTYDVIESNWYSQLGEGFNIQSPQQRFLAITISVTNSAGSDTAVPLLTLENSEGKDFVEVEKGDALQGWLGLIRAVGSGQNLQGKLLFDVPLGSYKLRLTDGGGTGTEKFSWVSIPLRMDIDTGVQSPIPGEAGK